MNYRSNIFSFECFLTAWFPQRSKNLIPVPVWSDPKKSIPDVKAFPFSLKWLWCEGEWIIRPSTQNVRGRTFYRMVNETAFRSINNTLKTLIDVQAPGPKKQIGLTTYSKNKWYNGY